MEIPLKCRTINSRACYVCMETDSLKKCSKCRVATYCGVAHQKLDYKNHKEICNALHTLIALGMYPLRNITSHHDYTVALMHLQDMLRDILNRELYRYEHNMITHPRSCEECLSPDNLLDCSKCHCASFCKEHEKSHLPEHCESLAMYFKLGKYMPKYTNPLRYQVASIPHDVTNLEENFVKLLEEDIPEEFVGILEKNALHCIKTAIYAMTKAGVIKDRLFPRENLTVHFVGAGSSEEETNWGICSDFLFHWLPNLKRAKYVFIGPELESTKQTFKTTMDLCKECAENKYLELEYHMGLYHDVKGLAIPDLVMACNAGLHAYDSWDLSLLHLLSKKSFVFCFTSYTQLEIEWDVEKLESLSRDVSFVVKNEKNPFCSSYPLRNSHISVDQQPVFYLNSWLSVIKK